MPKIRFTPEEMAKALLRHFQDDIPISTICAELSIRPNIFYAWQRQFFSETHLVFEPADQAVVYYPQSNGKIERWHKSFKAECIRCSGLTDLGQARLEIGMYMDFATSSGFTAQSAT